MKKFTILLLVLVVVGVGVYVFLSKKQELVNKETKQAPVLKVKTTDEATKSELTVNSSAKVAKAAESTEYTQINSEQGSGGSQAADFHVLINIPDNNSLTTLMINEVGNLYYTKAVPGQPTIDEKKLLTDEEFAGLKEVLENNFFDLEDYYDYDPDSLNKSIQALLNNQGKRVLCNVNSCPAQFIQIIEYIEEVFGKKI